MLWPVLAAAVDGPQLRVDASRGRHPISPDIYGINDYEDKGLGPVLGGGVRRWGGDLATRYHWKLDAANSASTGTSKAIRWIRTTAFTAGQIEVQLRRRDCTPVE